MRTIRLLLLPLLFLPLAACATKGDVRDLQTEIRELNARQEALIRELQNEQRSQRDSLRAVSRTFQEHRAQVNRQFAEMGDLVIRVQEIAGISQQELASIRDQLVSRQGGIFQGADPGPGSPGSEAAEAIYNEGVTQLRRGAYSSARLAFLDVIERFGNHDLAPHARYQLADTYLQQGDVETAIDHFLQVGEFHPDSDRVPDAYYRVGVLYRDGGDTARAREYFERVVNTWPQSGAADLARDALRSLP